MTSEAKTSCFEGLRGRAGAPRDEFEPVAPRVLREEASDVLDLAILAGGHAGGVQARSERVDGLFVDQAQGRVRLSGRPEGLLDADVDLLRAALKPEPAPRRERRRLRGLGPTQEHVEEAA